MGVALVHIRYRATGRVSPPTPAMAANRIRIPHVSQRISVRFTAPCSTRPSSFSWSSASDFSIRSNRISYFPFNTNPPPIVRTLARPTTYPRSRPNSNTLDIRPAALQDLQHPPLAPELRHAPGHDVLAPAQGRIGQCIQRDPSAVALLGRHLRML